jgi:hypothetical protein
MAVFYIKERQELKKILEKRARAALNSLSPELRKCLMRDLIKFILPQLKTKENGNRVTRSMSTRASNMIASKVPQVPSTPKISPFLPETPAAVKRIKETQQTATKNKTGTVMPSKEPRVLGSTITSNLTAPDPVLTVQLDNGKILNVNLATDPNNLRMSLGAEALKEVKQRMESYASQVANFFKRLKNI